MTIHGYMEILFPKGLLGTDTFVRKMTDVVTIPEEDWTNVEIVGWLYQYYISEENERVIQGKKKYKKEEIPYATQLFTPEWIVRYMVQNALGRYWIESHPEHRDLIKNWEYYIENQNLVSDFEEKLALYTNKVLNVEDIKCFDPAMGSGHILAYMFDVLYEIYSKCGYMEREIPRLIIEKNLYGLDIDKRAYQLACFTVFMKAQQYNHRFLRSVEREEIELNLATIIETNKITNDEIIYIAGETEGTYFNTVQQFIGLFKDAQSIGSLVKLEAVNIIELNSRIKQLEIKDGDLFELEFKEIIVPLLKQLIKQYKILTTSYNILVTNPPYMGGRYMPEILKDYININYSDSKSDIFSSFLEMCFNKINSNGILSFLTPFVWMYISDYEKLRKRILSEFTINSLIELEYNAFPEACVPVCTFNLRKNKIKILSQFIKLAEFPGADIQSEKVLEAINNTNCSYKYVIDTSLFNQTPESTFTYVLTRRMNELFNEGISIETLSDFTGSQNITANNKKYLRKWWEVNPLTLNTRWRFYAKGGKFRRHYGNLNNVVDWSAEARAFYKNNKTSNLLDEKYWYVEGITYTDITTTRASTFRYLPKGCVFDKSGPSINNVQYLYYVLAFFNTNIVKRYLEALNPTMHVQVKDVKNLPIIIDESMVDEITFLQKENIELTKKDWDSNESSHEFKLFRPLTFKDNNLKKTFEVFQLKVNEDYNKLKCNEEKINKLFLEIYGLINELDFQVKEEDISITKYNLENQVKNLLSYVIGLGFGRFKLSDIENINFEVDKYKKFNDLIKNVKFIELPKRSKSTKIEALDVLIEFLELIFDENSLEENLIFISEVLGKKNNETARETIRRYYFSEFNKHHLQIYQKTPVYWNLVSGKEKAFNGLISMHNYDKAMFSLIRTDYVHEVQNRIDAEKSDLLTIINSDSTVKEITTAKNELKSLEKKIDELKKYDELLHHIADQQIEIDLDDGVKHNYELFKGLVAKI
ncbi:BREX-1 system adenine-specific DNA-methyltransferase PglX [Lysinibacillus sp. CTST325]